MKTRYSMLALAAIVSAAALSSPSLANDLSRGSIGNQDAMRDMPGVQFEFRKAKPVPALRSESASRDLNLDPAATLRSFTAVGKTASGEEVRIEPSEAVKKALNGQLAPTERGNISGGSIDPISHISSEPFTGFGSISI